jgi:CubicO group peptidase (beta-lactamase class C family)
MISGVGGNVELFEKLLKSPNNQKINSILVFKDGKLIFERYRKSGDRDKLHDIRSSTKAITALLVGIAIDKGFIKSVEDSILNYFPERQNSNTAFSPIRIVDLLTMRSGLDSDDWDPKSPGNEEVMYTKDSWIEFFFNLNVDNKPGEKFRYSTAGVVLLGELIAKASKMPFDQFADKYLFQKLGIYDYSYDRTPVGEIDAGGHLKIKPRDFAKIGLLVLQKGVWDGQRVVSEKWVEEINEPVVAIPNTPLTGPYMGYLWWQEPVVNGQVRSFQSRGNGGQYLIAIPDDKILGVFTGSAYNSDRQFQPFILMKQYVIPGLR